MRRALFWGLLSAIAAMTVLEALFDVALERSVARHALNLAWGLAEPGRWPDTILANPLILDVVDVPAFILLAWGTASWLSRRFLRPLRALTLATEQLAAEQFPDPLPIPVDDDELAGLAGSFNRMSAAMRDLVERERTFTRYATHELRTPLSALKLQVERAQRSETTRDAALEAMNRNVSRMEDVIAALLSLAGSGDRDVTARPLATLIDEVLGTLPRANQARIELLSVPADTFVTDGALVQRALHNLLDNALKHGTPPTQVYLQRAERELTIRVRDFGSGVPEEALGHVHRPYVRADADNGGLGLGLALVSSISETLGGSLEMRNCTPGFEATLRLPIIVSRA